MHSRRTTRAALVLICALPIVAAAAEEGIQLKPQRSLLTLPPLTDEPAPVFMEADQLSGVTEKEAEAQGNVVFRRFGQSVSADWMRYETELHLLEAKGNVRAEYGGDLLEGDRLRINLGTERGFMENPSFRLNQAFSLHQKPPPKGPVLATPYAIPRRPIDEPLEGRGTAELLFFEGPDRYRVQKSSYTTCGPGNDDWFIKAREMDLDKQRNVGTAYGASLVFLDQTIFYTPYISFPLQQQRKSGLLSPHYGSSTSTGAEFTAPYYWNIAPNRDATFYPRVMSKRGVQLGSELRYLDPGYSGQARFEFLPDDRQTGENRYGVFMTHSQTFGNGWAGGFNLNRVSDDKYFTDLSTLVAVTSRTTLPNEGSVLKTGTWGDRGNYAFSAFAQTWQTLQTDPQVPITPPYNRMPQVSLTAFRQETLGGDFDLLSNFVQFEHPTLVSGKRALAYPSYSLPFQNAYAYLVPKAGVHATRYSVDPNTQGIDQQSTRTLPIATADAGLIFERDTTLTGLPFIQTVEPRLFYVYIPFRDQSRLPNFESGTQDVSFATIFTENQFSGNDRVNDANQVTVGVTTRLIHPDTGIERVRAAVAQRFYFQDQRVTLPGVAPRPDHTGSSDILTALSGTIAQYWTADAGWQYSTDRSQTQKFNVATRYQPAPGKVLNLAYRHTVDLVKQTDLSFQWPMTSHWAAIGRWNWSIQDHRTLEGLAGLEYDGGCWIFRAVGHRFVTALNAVNTAVFFQLELNGVSRIGSNPMDVLRRNVGGYTRLDPRAPRTDEYVVPGR